jgi:hypothetical protein
MAWKLLNALDEHGYPELAARARELNERDNFVMKYDPVEIEKRERTERQRKKDSKRRKDKKKEDASKRTRVDSPTSTADNG